MQQFDEHDFLKFFLKQFFHKKEKDIFKTILNIFFYREKNLSECISNYYQIIFPLQYIIQFWTFSFYGLKVIWLDKFITFYLVYVPQKVDFWVPKNCAKGGLHVIIMTAQFPVIYFLRGSKASHESLMHSSRTGRTSDMHAMKKVKPVLELRTNYHNILMMNNLKKYMLIK